MNAPEPLDVTVASGEKADLPLSLRSIFTLCDAAHAVAAVGEVTVPDRRTGLPFFTFFFDALKLIVRAAGSPDGGGSGSTTVGSRVNEATALSLSAEAYTFVPPRLAATPLAPTVDTADAVLVHLEEAQRPR